MHPPIVGLKVAVLNAAAGMASVVPAAAVIQVSETAQQAQTTDHALLMLSLGLGILSSVVALAWNGLNWLIWWRNRRNRRDPK